jgi:argininosuccinate synthase
VSQNKVILAYSGGLDTSVILRWLIDGEVVVELYKGNVMPVSRSSPTSLYSKDLSSMDKEGGFDQTDSAGFIRINGLRLRAHKAIVDKRGLGRYKVEE